MQKGSQERRGTSFWKAKSSLPRRTGAMRAWHALGRMHICRTLALKLPPGVSLEGGDARRQRLSCLSHRMSERARQGRVAFRQPTQSMMHFPSKEIEPTKRKWSLDTKSGTAGIKAHEAFTVCSSSQMSQHKMLLNSNRHNNESSSHASLQQHQRDSYL